MIKDIEDLIESLRILFITIMSFIVYINCSVNFKKVSFIKSLNSKNLKRFEKSKTIFEKFQMKEILETFRNNWLNLKSEEERRIFQKLANEGRRFIIFFSCNNFFFQLIKL